MSDRGLLRRNGQSDAVASAVCGEVSVADALTVGFLGCVACPPQIGGTPSAVSF